MVQPHGLFDLPNGKLYFVELTGDRMSELNPKTGQIERWKVPTEGGGMHSVWPDSKGNFWYTYFAAAGKIARFDSKTKQTKEYPVDKGPQRLRHRHRQEGPRLGGLAEHAGRSSATTRRPTSWTPYRSRCRRGA